MNIHHLTPELLRGMSVADVPSPEQQDRLEVRVLSLYLTLAFINDLIGPITYIYRLSRSMLHQVANMSHVPWLLGGMFAVALALAVPHAIALIALPQTLHVRWPRKAATAAAAIVMLAWAYLAILALPLDAGPLFWLYLRQGLASAGLAFVYAISLNAQLLRAIAALAKKVRA